MKTSVRLLSLAVTVAIPLVSTTAPAQKAAPPSKVELEAITARGRLLAEYSLAATGAADAVKAMRPALGCPEVRPGDDARLIARKSDKVWVVVFGRMNEQRDKFLIACEATQAKPQGKFTVTKYGPPKEDAEFLLAAAKAFETALQEFRGSRRPYTAFVLPAESAQLYVYALPAQTAPDIYPLGGDVRYLFSADGSQILARRTMHSSILEFRAADHPVAHMHEHILSEVPEDSDVFHVLTRKPAVDEFIGTRDHAYIVRMDGKISREK